MNEPKHPTAFSMYPMVTLAAAFAAGIVAAQFADVDWKLFLTAGACLGLVAVAFSRKAFAAIFVFAAFFCVGGFCYQIETESVSAHRLKRMFDDGRVESGEPAEIEGEILGAPEPAHEGLFITLRAEKIIYRGTEQKASGSIRLFAPFYDLETTAEFDKLGLRSGARVRVACRPEREERYQNPGVLSHTQLLDIKYTDATATLKSPLLVEVLQRDSSFRPLGFIYDLRRDTIEWFRASFETTAAGVLIAANLGDKYFLDKGTADIFREGGTFHILVISGLHVTSIGGLLLLVVRLFTRNRKLQFVVTVSLLWIFTLAVGAEAPVTRASIMFTIFTFSYLVFRTGTLLNAFGFTALILLALRPSELFNPSFQLTFLSVGAIVVMAFPLIEKLRSIGRWTPSADQPFPANVPRWSQRICETIYWREEAWKVEQGRQIWTAGLFKSPYWNLMDRLGLRRAVSFVFEGIVVSVIVAVWMLPLNVFYFHRVSLASFFLIIWAGVLLATASISAFFAFLVSRISDILAAPFIVVAELCSRLLIWGSSLAVEGGWASFRLPIYSGPMRSLYFIYFIPVIVLGAVVFLWDPFRMTRQKLSRHFLLGSSAAVFIIGAIILFHPGSTPSAHGKLRVDFLDVGQGDSALVTFPNGETMLVDGGGRIRYGKNDDDKSEVFEPDIPSIGEFVVSEYLWERGYSRVDSIVATHADADHIQGLGDILRNFTVGKIYSGGLGGDDADADDFLTAAKISCLPIETLRKGDVIEIGGARVEVLHPNAEAVSGRYTENDRSVVLRIVYGETSILLTGDIEKAAEAILTDAKSDLKASIVKVPHHGSRTSSTQQFVDAVNARYAIISVGKRSMFGHPNKEVIERWRNVGADVMLTGEKGTISISSDGERLEIWTFLK
ncbi:MAG: ComEC/Rec2 family competence protein [Blastocatellia bacterium]